MASLTFGQSVRYWTDFTLSYINIFFGRLLPGLYPEQVDLSGKTAIITGANSGIGLQMATDLARQGAEVYLACRSIPKAEQAVEDIIRQCPEAKGKLHVVQLDTSSLENVRAFAKGWAALKRNTIDILCLNAGAGQPPSADQFYSVDGFEFLYVTNFLSNFLLTHLLEPYLASAARIVSTSSVGSLNAGFSPNFVVEAEPVKKTMEIGFHCPVFHLFGKKIVLDDDDSRYNHCKAMQAAFTTSLQQYLDRKAAVTGGVNKKTAHAFSPGFCMTPIFSKLRDISWSRDPIYSILCATLPIAVPVSQGAATGTWLATTNDENVIGPGKAGGYWERMTRRMSTGDSIGQAMLDRMWARWEIDAGIQWRA